MTGDGTARALTTNVRSGLNGERGASALKEPSRIEMTSVCDLGAEPDLRKFGK